MLPGEVDGWSSCAASVRTRFARAGVGARTSSEFVVGSARMLTRVLISPGVPVGPSSSRASSTAMSLAMALFRRMTSISLADGVSIAAMMRPRRRTFSA